MVLLVLMWGGTVVVKIERYVHRDVYLCATPTSVSLKGNEFFVEFIVASRA